MHRRLVGPVVAVLVLGIFLPVSTGASAVPPGAASSCPEFLFLGARGSGQKLSSANANMGPEIFSQFTEVKSALGSRVQGYGIPYAAAPAWEGGGAKALAATLGTLYATTSASPWRTLAGYLDSVAGGVEQARRRLAACSSSKLLLSGYSQGADVIGRVLETLDDADRARVAGVTLFGDPYFRGDDPANRSGFEADRNGILGAREPWPDWLDGKLASYCHHQDPICQGFRWHTVSGSSVSGSPPTGWAPRLDSVTPAQHANYDERAPLAGGRLAATSDTTDGARFLLAGAGLEPAATPSDLDLVLVVDTTGSMRDYIDDVREQADTIAGSLAARFRSHRFALVEYKDAVDLFQARLDVPFTDDLDELKAGLDALHASGGGDNPESVYSGVMLALDQPWREGARKLVLVLADARPHDPEPLTGWTAPDVLARARAEDPAAVISTAVSADDLDDFFEPLTAGTAGSVIDARDTSTIAGPLDETFRTTAAAPLASLTLPPAPLVGAPTALSAAGSTTPEGRITGYDWDVDGDGSFDRSTTGPATSHTWNTPGEHTVNVRVTNAAGVRAVTAATVEVTAPAEELPDPPGTIGAATTHGYDAVLTWPASPGARAYEILQGATRVGVTTSTSLSLGWVPAGTHSWSVRALNDTGASGFVTTAPLALGRERVKPAVTITAPTTATTLKPRVTYRWRVSDAQSGLARVTVQHRLRSPKGKSAGWRSISGGSGSGSVAGGSGTWTANLKPGWTRCLRVAASDRVGNASGWTAPRCSSAPRDDRSFSAGKWQRRHAGTAYRGTVTTTKAKGRKASIRITASRAWLLVRTGPRAGSIAVYVNGKRVAKTSLRSSSPGSRRIALNKRSMAHRSLSNARVVVKVTSSRKTVSLDGLVFLPR